METVERDLGLGQMRARPSEVRPAHVDAGGNDLGRVAATRPEVLNETGHGTLAAPLAGNERMRRPEVVEQRDIVMPAPRSHNSQRL